MLGAVPFDYPIKPPRDAAYVPLVPTVGKLQGLAVEQNIFILVQDHVAQGLGMVVVLKPI